MLFRKDMIAEKKAKNLPKEKLQKFARYGMNEELFAALKKLRSELAAAAKVPAYVIFHDSTLIDMCYRQPKKESEFLQISGVGKSKMDKYGDKFLAVIREFNGKN